MLLLSDIHPQHLMVMEMGPERQRRQWTAATPTWIGARDALCLEPRYVFIFFNILMHICLASETNVNAPKDLPPLNVMSLSVCTIVNHQENRKKKLSALRSEFGITVARGEM